MATKAILNQRFDGGWATSPRIGTKHSFDYSQSLDFRKSPGQMSVLPKTTKEDEGNVTDLILNEVMTADGTIYAFGDTGKFYRRTTAGVWSLEANLSSGCAGMDYRRDANSIYLASNKTVSLYSPTNSSPFMNPDFYGASFSTYNNSSNVGFNVSAYQVGSSFTTTIPVATTPLTENDTVVRYFQTDIEPLQRLSVFVVAKGTGDWTLTVHDGLNNVLGTSTTTNANLNDNAFNDFYFTSATNQQIRLYPAPNARTYHFHLTSTVADGTVSSSQTDNLSSCDLMLYADRLVQTDNGLHPIQRFLQSEAIGNGNYLSFWEPIETTPSNSEWQRHKLRFPDEYEVCGLAVQNEFLVIATERKTNSNTSVPQKGILFFWDGTSETYNYFVSIEEGSPQAIHSYENIIYYYAGGAWYALTSAYTQPVKLRTFPGVDTEYSGTNSYINVNPYAATVRRGIHLMGWPGESTDTAVNFGVYSWGSVDKNYSASFGYSYLLSTGSKNYTAQNNLQIGGVFSFGDLLHISWRDTDNGGYGVDYVDNTSTPSAYAEWKSLVYDGGYAAKQKTAAYMECYYELPAGATITLSYAINNGSFVEDTVSYSTTELWQGLPNYARFSISENYGGRFNEIQLRIVIECDETVTTPPTLELVSLVYDDNSSEVLV